MVQDDNCNMEQTPLLASQVSPPEDILSNIVRFSKRTYAASSQNLVKIISGVSGSQCVTDDEFEPIHTISASESVVHLLKGHIGIGILALPIAFSHAGLLGGVFCFLFLLIIYVHCANMLASAAQKLISINDLLFLDYADTAEISFIEAGGKWARCSEVIRHVINMFLFMSQVGNNAIYIMFVAQNIMPYCETKFTFGWSYNDYLMALTIPTILICSIRQLKNICLLTILANILEFCGLSIVFYYIFSSPFPSLSSIPLFVLPSNLPVCFGIIMFALGGISVVLPIQNQMANPQKMLGVSGTLNISISSCGFLLIIMGCFGFLKCGFAIQSTITLNLPNGEVLAQACQVMFALAVFFSYALQYFTVMEIAGPNIIEPLIDRNLYLFVEYLFRAILNIFIIGLAALVPWMDLLVTLVSSLTIAPVTIIIPALIDTAVNWQTDSKTKFILRSVKNLGIFLVGASAMLFGTYFSILDMRRRSSLI